MYLVSNKIIEPLEQIGNSHSPSVSIQSPQIIFLTNNQVNYELLDKHIDSIDRQYTFINNNINNFTMKVGTVDTGLGGFGKPNIDFFGSYPTDINLNFLFAYPLPGSTGEKGDNGHKGIKGRKGDGGPIGIRGGNNYGQ